MIDKTFIDQIRRIKQERRYTLHELSQITGIQIATLGRWLKTNRINKVYAEIVRSKLGIEQS